MGIRPFNWHCPHCDHKVSITNELFSSDVHRLLVSNADGKLALGSQFIVCPNDECKKATLSAYVRKWKPVPNGDWAFDEDTIVQWRLIPFGAARPIPDFVPTAIREDYKEACLIRELSPKSAATLARRALQGILRDFYKVKAGRLVDEIGALENTMEPDLLDAIHGVRKVGNIGAHMESDINVIVEVDPSEAQLLIELVETMIDETYVRRDQRSKRLAKVSAMAKVKEADRKAPPAAAATPAIPPPPPKAT